MHGQFVIYRSNVRDRMARVFNGGSVAIPRTIRLDGLDATLYGVGDAVEHEPLVGERVLLPLVDGWDLLEYVQSDDCPTWESVEAIQYRWPDRETFNADLIFQLERALESGMGVLRTVTPQMAVQRGWATPDGGLPVAPRPVEARDGESSHSLGAA